MPGNFSSYVVYADESGDHNLAKIDEKFPVFVLSFCVFEKQNYTDLVVPLFQKLKFKHFGHDAIILHERDISKELGVFSPRNLRNKEGFLDDLSETLSSAPFTIISCCIDKRKLAQRYQSPENPYEIAVQFCLERLYYFLKGVGDHTKPCHVIFEARGKKEDAELELAFRRACASNYTGNVINCIPVIQSKGVNSSGLQVADLVSRPIGRHIINPTQTNRAYNIVATKFYRRPGGSEMGYGLKCFP